MSEQQRLAPSFASPPLVEVALSVQFDPLPGLHAAHLGLLWTRFRDRFPRTEEHSPLPEAVERFGLRSSARPAIGIKLLDMPPMPRVWFLNNLGTQLIQVQQDRFVYNWRKGAGSDPYPHYEPMRDAFTEALATFQQFLTEEGVGEFIPNQCEVTYVDHVLPDGGWRRHGELGEVVTLWAGQTSGTFLPEPEQATLSVQYVISRGDASEPLGRLHISVEPAYRAGDAAPILVINATARGRPDGEGSDGALRFLDLGHEWVVASFTAITTPKMQKIWGRNDGL